MPLNPRVHQWDKITLLGVGLLGGSIGLAAQKYGQAKSVTGYVRRAESVAECTEVGATTEATMDFDAAVADADLLILCTPISAMRALAERLSGKLKPGAIVTDVGSVKSTVVREVEGVVTAAGGHFVGSHPMAGSETAGVKFAKEDLLKGRLCVITPTPKSDPEAVAKVEAFWAALGSRTLQMTPESHDELVSRSSHLPHIVSAVLAGYVLSPDHGEDQGRLCATGFRDTTRIASGDIKMWTDIVAANRKNLAWVLEDLIGELQSFQAALKGQDYNAIGDTLTRAKDLRDAWGEQFQKSPSHGEES